MSTLAPPERRRLGDGERRLLGVAGVLVASGLVHGVVLVLGDRPWTGPLSWRKPATFGLSFGLTLATVVWVTSYLRMSPRLRSTLLGVFAADCVVEVTGVTLQAWRDRPSHLNTSTPFDATVAYTLAAGGGVLIVVLACFAVPALLGRTDAGPEMRLALRVGFGLLVAALLAGAAMIVHGRMVMAADGVDAGYRAAGFLKVFHGVTLHAVLVLPAVAALTRSLPAVRVASACYLLLAGATLLYGLAG